MDKPIMPGVEYWAEFAHTRFRVIVVEQPPEIPGWWRCVGEGQDEVILPESALKEVAHDE